MVACTYFILILLLPFSKLYFDSYITCYMRYIYIYIICVSHRLHKIIEKYYETNIQDLFITIVIQSLYMIFVFSL